MIRRHIFRLLPYVLRLWPGLLVILLLSIVTSLLTALQPWPLKLLVDYALADAMPNSSLDSGSVLELPELLRGVMAWMPWDSGVSLVAIAALSSLGLYGINAALDAGLSLAWAMVGQKTVYTLSETLFHQVQRLSLSFQRTHTNGDFLSRLSGDTYSAYVLVDALLVAPIRHVLLLATIGLVAWRLDARLALWAFAVVPLMVVAALFFGTRLKRRMRQYRRTQSSLMSFVHQVLTAIPIVQAFRTEAQNRKRFYQLAQGSVVHAQQNTLLKTLFSTINGSISMISTAVILFLGGQQVLVGQMSVGSLLVFLAYLKSIQVAFNGLFTNYGTLKSLEASVDRIFEIVDSSDRLAEPLNPRQLAPVGVKGQVQFENVRFGYNPMMPTLKDVSLHVQPGETIAIAGPTGAGKSTLVSLIPRFFDPQQGRVLIDSVDLREMGLEDVRSQVGLVLQDPFLLPMSIADNISYGRPSASEREIVNAAKLANAHSFIHQLPQGYDTVIGERGSTLSGGEKQRVSIARALLKNAPILILDEPTSALDARTESSLMEALERLMIGRTTFIIAHRLSTVKQASRIVVMKKGRIVEIGTHQELLKRKGLYSRLHAFQSQTSEEVVLR